MKTLKFIAVLMLLFAADVASAQQLTQAEKNELQLRVKQKLEDFQMYCGSIASKKVSLQNKNAAKANALELFIGKGGKYTMTEIDIATGREYTMTHDPVTMQTSGLRSGKRPPVPMVDYLESLKNYTRYSKVVIESADAVRVDDDLREVSPGRYEGVAYFYQNFYGFVENRVVYSDKTVKKVKIYLELVEVPTVTGKQKIWKVLLGDISVVSTSRIRR